MGRKWKLSKKDLKEIGLFNVHLETEDCHARGCVIHHWSAHHMRDMQLDWRMDKNCFERLCQHGVGHPDPDGANWLINRHPVEANYFLAHGCDGCCHPPLPDLKKLDSAEKSLKRILKATKPEEVCE